MKRFGNAAAALTLAVAGFAAEGCANDVAPTTPAPTTEPAPVGPAVPAAAARGTADAPPQTHLGQRPPSGAAPSDMRTAGRTSIDVPAPKPGTPQWGREAGASGADAGSAIVSDENGNSYVTGFFASSIDFGCGALAATGEYDMFLVKYTASGACAWSKRAGGAGFTNGIDVALDGAGGVYVTGSFAGKIDIAGQPLVSAAWLDGFVAKFATDGTFAWANRFGGAANDVPSAIAVHAGAVVVAGAFYGRSNFGGADVVSTGDADAFVASYSTTTGAHVWSQRFGGPGWDVANTVAFDRTGRIAFGGHFEQTVAFGVTNLVSAGLTDAFLVTLDAGGTLVEARRFGGLGDDEVTRLAPDASDGTYVVGTFQTSADFGGGPLTGAGDVTGFAARFGGNGAHLWSTAIDATTRAAASGLAVTADGDLLVTGSFLGTSAFGSSSSPNNSAALVMKYAANGALSWSRTLGNVGNAEGKGIAVSGSLITLTGDFDTTLDASIAMPASAGSTDVFVVALSN